MRVLVRSDVLNSVYIFTWVMESLGLMSGRSFNNFDDMELARKHFRE